MLKVTVIMVGLIVGSAATASLESKEAVAKPGELPKPEEAPKPEEEAPQQQVVPKQVEVPKADTDKLFDYLLQKRWISERDCPANNPWNRCCEALWKFITYNGSALCTDATDPLNWTEQHLVDVVQNSCPLKYKTFVCTINRVPYNGVPHSGIQTLAILVFFIPSTLLLLLM